MVSNNWNNQASTPAQTFIHSPLIAASQHDLKSQEGHKEPLTHKLPKEVRES